MENKKLCVKTHPQCAPQMQVRGKTYRISVLTAGLLRLEYAPDGLFEDRATQMVYNRDFAPVEFTVKESDTGLELTTARLHLTYNKQEFSKNGLKVVVTGGWGWSSTWMYGEPVNDLGGTARTLDGVDGAIPLDHGVLSRDGYSVLDDSGTMALTPDGWVEPRAAGKRDLYFFGYGCDYAACIRDFYHLCGSQPLLPRFALGNWWSRYHKYTETEYKQLVERFEREKLPFSVAVIDMDWHLVDIDPRYGSGWTGYTWNTALFPDPPEFLAWLHRHGMKVTLNVHPADGIRAHEAAYPQAARAMGMDPASKAPIAFDAADPHFMQVYFDEVHHPLEDQGVDFWWVDWQQGNNTKIPGLDPLWMLNHYHYLDSARRGRRAMTFSRYAGPGSHRYPIGFSGDTFVSWQSLKFQPYFTATASNIGYGWWSHDIGGHMGGARDDELAARWVQFGVFSPINRLHSTDNEFNGKEPWNFGRDACAVMEKYLRLRQAMLPYLYTMNELAHREGQPLIRPMYWVEPRNMRLYFDPALRNEYYFGTQLIAAPITDPADPVAKLGRVRAWLPAGRWFDFFSGVSYTGDRILDLYRPLDDIPVLAKAGAIVPLQKPGAVLNDVGNPAAFEVHVFPGADGTFTIREDRDEAEDAPENWASTRLSLHNGGDAAFTIAAAAGNLAAIPAKRSYTLRFCSVQQTDAVVEGAQAQVSYCQESHVLMVELAPTTVTQEIRVKFGGPLRCASNPIERLGRELLNRAQTGYEEKAEAFRLIRQQGTAAVGSLMALVENEALRGALVELLTADTTR
jgi:alpha-glucosidase (family GH31 glycosyl hydrolase)